VYAQSFPTTAAAWRIASLSPIGRLEVIYDFKPYDNVNLYSRMD
jgi:hypothetical protein